jgi:hypothetical protein
MTLYCAPAITDPPGFVFPSSDMLKITANG